MSSSCIRPVTKRFPASKELWDDTNLPMCVVVTPLAEDEDDKESVKAPLSAIPKCLHCGAPHPTKETHYRHAKRSILLCHLCGETSSLKFKDQQAERVDEKLDKATFDKISCPEGVDHVFDMPYFDGNDRIPAMACPPVWWIVLDASQTSRQDYWTAVGKVLESTLADIPPYVHVGIVASGTATISSWDLTSPVPHVVQYPLEDEVDFCLVPADSLHLTSIQSAVRAAADAHASGTLGHAEDENDGMALGLTIELLLEYMEQASHPGENPQDDEDEEDEDTPKSPLKYAGGKILVLLGNPPSEIEDKEIESQPQYYQGGVAGACSPESGKWEGTFVPEEEPTDLTPQNLANFTNPLDPEDMFQTIGTRCANAALGVDLLVVVPEYGDDADADAVRTAIRPWYGLPLLRILSESSGAPGPLLFGTQDVAGLEENILARTPWAPGMTFSSELRLRLPPDVTVEGTPVEAIGNDKMQVAQFLSSDGVAGPAVGIDENLWLMGTCNESTTLTIDLEVGKEMQEEYTVEGVGEIPAKPLIQVCCAYTCIEEGEDGNAYAVRKMKVSSLEMPLASESEEIFDGLDPEALAVPLFHKLSLNAYQEGLEEAQDTGLKWLVSLLVCVYQSAMVEQARIEEMKEEQGNMVETGSTFVAAERLLDEEGDMEVADVLLGQGHEMVSKLATLIYGLLQCDALRPTCGDFEPSMDGRCAALTQMSSMSPLELRNCISPVLQLWSTTKDEIIMESLSLNKSDVKAVLEEIREKGCVLFLDSPQGIMVCRAEWFAGSKSRPSGPAKLGKNLRAAIKDASYSYSTKVNVEQELSPEASKLAKRLEDFLIEDHGLAGGIQDFAEWKVEVAAQVQEALEENGDIDVDEEE